MVNSFISNFPAIPAATILYLRHIYADFKATVQETLFQTNNDEFHANQVNTPGGQTSQTSKTEDSISKNII